MVFERSMEISAIVFVKVTTGIPTDQAVSKIKQKAADHVREIYYVAGKDIDIAITLSAVEKAQLNNLIDQIEALDEVNDAWSAVILERVHEIPVPLTEKQFYYFQQRLEDEYLRPIKEGFASLIEIPTTARVIEIREIPFKKVKEMIFDYLLTHKETVYPDGIADVLSLDLKDVIEAIEQLKKEGKVEEI